MTDLYQAIVEQAPEAMIFADREGVIRLWNARAEQMFGYAASEAVGGTLDLIIPPHLRAAHKDGSKLYVDVAFAIVLDERQRVLGALATARKSTKPQASG
jgi:PAS domain-containing protein